MRGQWQSHVKVVQAPLLKNELASGERIVKVSEQGKPQKRDLLSKNAIKMRP